MDEHELEVRKLERKIIELEAQKDVLEAEKKARFDSLQFSALLFATWIVMAELSQEAAFSIGAFMLRLAGGVVVGVFFFLFAYLPGEVARIKNQKVFPYLVGFVVNFLAAYGLYFYYR